MLTFNMARVIKILLKKLNPEPSVRDMKEFGLSFSKRQWDYLCSDKTFIGSIDKDLRVARKISEIILKSFK